MEEQKTKICKHCGTEIPYLAKVCPNCRKNQGSKGKWIGIGIAVFFVFGIIGSATSDEDHSAVDNQFDNNTVQTNSNTEKTKKDSDMKKKPDKKEEIEYLKVTSTKLIQSFKDNQVKCDRKYGGKYLEVTGKVDNVGTDILDQIYVCLGSDEEYTFVGIQCYAKDSKTEDKIAELKEGDKITVIGKGECDSLSFSIKNAEIVD